MEAEGKNTITPVEYIMENEVNGEKVEIKGSGFHDSSGLMSVNSTVSTIPQGWNPLVSIFICSGPGPGPEITLPTMDFPDASPGLIGFFPNGYRTADKSLRQATIWNADGKRVASIDAIGIYKKSENKFTFEIDVKTLVEDKNALTNMSDTGSYHFFIQQNRIGFVEVIAQYTINCTNESKLFGSTKIKYQGMGDSKDMKKLDSSLIGFNEIKMNSTKNLLQYTIRQHVKSVSKLGLM